MSKYNNSGILFKNKRKTKDSHPDYTGTFTDANGEEHWFSGWLKDGKEGKFISVSVGEVKKPMDGADKEDDVPFF